MDSSKRVRAINVEFGSATSLHRKMSRFANESMRPTDAKGLKWRSVAS